MTSGNLHIGWHTFRLEHEGASVVLHWDGANPQALVDLMGVLPDALMEAMGEMGK